MNVMVKSLRQKLVSGENFEKIYNLFFDLVESHTNLLMGESKMNEDLHNIIAMTMKQIMIRKNMKAVVSMDSQMIYVESLNLYHGSIACVGGWLFTYFYFTDLDKGMLACAKPMSKDTEVMFARITSVSKIVSKDTENEASLN